MRFAGVGATGIVVNQLLFWLWVGVAHRHYALGAVVATQGSTLWNFGLTERWVFPGAGVRRLGARLSWFLAVNNSALLLRVPLLALLLSVLGINYLVSNFLTLVALFLLRFLISERFIWKADTASTTTAAAAPATRARSAATGSRGVLPFRYQVGGFVSVASEIRLRELEYFRVRGLDGDPDIRVRVKPVGEPGLRARPVVTHGQSFVTYEEHLGQRGANFRLDFDDDRIDVAVAPLLGRSPHVVYTNVVEALLRFVLVSRGCLLLHSATVELDGHGVMLTARTDTGKTGTVLRLLRERQGGFLSDDMTIVEPGGRAHCYPKPPPTSAGAAVGSPAATTLPQRSGYAWCDDPGVDCPASGQVPASLRRPLRIPPKPAAGRCPRTTTTRRARWGELLLGPGLVYAGSVSPGGPQRLIVLQARGRPVAGWRGFKTRWVIDPSYAGPVLLRGRTLDGPTPVGFGLDPTLLLELQLWPRGPNVPRSVHCPTATGWWGRPEQLPTAPAG